MKENSILVIIPTLNESANIVNLIDRILELENPLDVLVIDDDSSDQTSELVNATYKFADNVNLITRKMNHGYTPSLLCGFQWAIKNKYEYTITLDADFSHDPTYIPIFLENLEHSSLVIGSRFHKAVIYKNIKVPRLFISYIFNKYLLFLLPLHVTDMTSGFRAYKTDDLKKIINSLKPVKGFAVIVQILYYLLKNKYMVKEIPIQYSLRKKGYTKLNTSILFEMVILPFRLLKEK